MLVFYIYYREGNPYIYTVLDWSKPQKALVTTMGILILACFLHAFFFVVFKVRYSLHSLLCSKKLTESNLKHYDGGISIITDRKVNNDTFIDGFTNINIVDKFDEL